jgi:hypothetical protein
MAHDVNRSSTVSADQMIRYFLCQIIVKEKDGASTEKGTENEEGERRVLDEVYWMKTLSRMVKLCNDNKKELETELQQLCVRSIFAHMLLLMVAQP